MIAIASFYFWCVPMMANTPAAPDPLISGNWIIHVIGAVSTAAALFWGKQQKDKAKKAEERTTTIEGQPIGVKMHEDFVTHEELGSHISRIEGDIGEIKNALDGERSIARTAHGNLHKRIDAMSERLGERLSNLEGTVGGIETTTNKLLDLALADKSKPGGRTR